ncbi:RNA-directed DNA polymerase, eukaryota [Tanacetum coccineum]
MAEIKSQLVTSLWGNPNVEFLVRSVVGASGGTLLVWDSLIFTKVDQLVGSYFIGVIGKRHGVNETIALVNIYGSQSGRHKEELCSELQNIMISIKAVWIFLGDFKAVCSQDKRLATLFIERDAKAFNEFIASGGLYDLPLGGGGVNVSFSKVVENSWKSDDSTGSSSDIVRKNKIKKLKADIKTWWHGFSAENEIRKKSMRQNINGLKVNGCWVEDPTFIFSAAYEHFANIFRKSNPFKLKFHSPLFKILDQEDVASLESSFSIDEVKAAVWDCSSSKSPGPDDVNFKLVKKYWDFIKFEFFNFIKFFESRGRLARGCNASFIVLIPKVPDPLDLSDYRPISLIGCMYKVLLKL